MSDRWSWITSTPATARRDHEEQGGDEPRVVGEDPLATEIATALSACSARSRPRRSPKRSPAAWLRATLARPALRQLVEVVHQRSVSTSGIASRSTRTSSSAVDPTARSRARRPAPAYRRTRPARATRDSARSGSRVPRCRQLDTRRFVRSRCRSTRPRAVFVGEHDALATRRPRTPSDSTIMQVRVYRRRFGSEDTRRSPTRTRYPCDTARVRSSAG